FDALGRHLEPGDVLVVNDSGTLAAAVDGHRPGGDPVTVHFAGPARPSGPARTGDPGQTRDPGQTGDPGRTGDPGHSGDPGRSGGAGGGDWVVELRRADRAGPVRDVVPGAWVRLPGGYALVVRDAAGAGG